MTVAVLKNSSFKHVLHTLIGPVWVFLSSIFPAENTLRCTADWGFVHQNQLAEWKINYFLLTDVWRRWTGSDYQVKRFQKLLCDISQLFLKVFTLCDPSESLLTVGVFFVFFFYLDASCVDILSSVASSWLCAGVPHADDQTSLIFKH